MLWEADQWVGENLVVVPEKLEEDLAGKYQGVPD